MKTAELYATVTRRIIAELETGAVPWTKPWRSISPKGSILPHNGATRRPYSGINIPILWGAAMDAGYSEHQWMTYKQALGLGAQVRGGEHGTTVVFTKKLRVGEEEDQRLISMLRTFSVFNVAQIDGLPVKSNEVDVQEPDRAPVIERFVEATRAVIRNSGNQPMYVPSQDIILMPNYGQFKDGDHYYATELHEGHRTGHEKRLNRDLKNRFGTRAYATEELIAELTAAFLCAHLSIQGELRHAGYIADWIALLKADDRAIFTAASKASQAAEYLRQFSETVPQAETELAA